MGAVDVKESLLNYGEGDTAHADMRIITRYILATLERAIDGGEAYRIIRDGEKVGGVVIRCKGNHGELELLFVSPKAHSEGIGYAAWCEIEKLHSNIEVWETVTPYYEKRNIHFYVNRCGFHIVEFYNEHHPDPNDPYKEQDTGDQFPDGVFRFEKRNI